MEKQVAIIGLGKMGTAIAKSLLKHGYEVHAFDISKAVEKDYRNLKNRPVFHGSLADLVARKLPTVLAVKPGLIKSTVSHIDDNRLLISIAAGVSIKTIDAARPTPGPTVRAMPNTPLQAGAGMTCLYANSDCSDEMREFTANVFEAGGEIVYLDSEKHMHAVTALSGSGPAFFYQLMQAMEDAGVLLGLPRDLARQLVVQTSAGAAALQKRSGRSAQELIHDVTSPAGTTIVGLKMLKKFGVENAVIEAVRHAAERSVQISKSTGG